MSPRDATTPARLTTGLLALWVGLGPLAACDDPDAEPTADVTAEEDAAPRPDSEEPAGPSIDVTDFAPGPMGMRRLTRSQYLATVRGLFGQDLEILPPTEVDVVLEGLVTIGGQTASITPAGLEGYEASARQIAATVLGPDRRGQVVPCTPGDEALPDDACTLAFVEAVAPGVLRRALQDGEAARYVTLAASATETLGDYWAGLEALLVRWLISPDFLFIQERAQGAALTATTLASRLSYFLWHEGPDAELLAAAADGSLATDAGYALQLDRLLADEARLERGTRALFDDLLELGELAHVDKDLLAFPAFTSKAVEDAREQTLRTIVDHLLVQRADYRDLFTTRKTFMTRDLGPIYEVAVSEEWEAHEFPEGSPRAGILTHVSFLALQARSSRSSPVLRGDFIIDKLLCLYIAPPPPDVNFDGLAPTDANAPTARERLAAHREDPACFGCHALLDPIGLALENFDAIGRYRTHEQGALIETYGDLLGEEFDDVRGFHQALRDAPELTQCLVDKLYMHGVGRPTVPAEAELLEALEADFVRDGHDVVALMRHIALSHGFRATSGPAEAEAPEADAEADADADAEEGGAP